MGYILKLPTAGAAGLPSLGDIGYISKQNLRGLYLIDGGAGLTDASGNGNHLTRSAGSVDPAYAAGVLQFRAASAHQLTTGITVAGPNQTIILAYKKITSPAGGMIPFAHLAASLAGSTAGPMTLFDSPSGAAGNTVQNWGQQTKRPQWNYSNNGIGVWRVGMGVRDANGISISDSGQTPVTLTYTTPDPGTTTSNAVVIGDSTGGTRHLDADVGFFAVYDRALTAAELTSTYKAVKRLMAAKGIVL